MLWLHTGMTKTFVALIALICLAGFTSGCYHTPDGRSRMGVPMAKDEIHSRYQRSVAQIIAAAREVLTHQGTLVLDNSVNNTLEAKVDGRDVVVKVSEVEPGISEIVTQVRTKAGFGDVDLAAELDKQIALRLR
jgi:hypothetical protein